MAKEILFNIEARDQLKKGIDTLANAVKVTLGPKGRNVIIEKKFGAPHITKDPRNQQPDGNPHNKETDCHSGNRIKYRPMRTK